ncbi:helix-turn-helix transcriptional regulator [Staphylococcus pseudoxylosus]|uniref:helix-turn-helix transcriptional regulator n=1 Tax=Staphylococcus pseudoxylosus TaxID=2282419 RepID=UPI002DB86B8E|nr:helix-turn-helix transcriptional regulator [Staphylococcus pseudoxylosus]MEB7754974.1 helix-turn-helix domain-containing protein [Staphylococcus pseudoxylosus]
MFANNLAKLRKEENVSQEELAQKLFVSKQTIYKWENNRSSPDIDNVLVLSEYFNVSVEDLLKKDCSGVFVGDEGKFKSHRDNIFCKLGKYKYLRELVVCFLAITFFVESLVFLLEKE